MVSLSITHQKTQLNLRGNEFSHWRWWWWWLQIATVAVAIKAIAIIKAGMVESQVTLIRSWENEEKIRVSSPPWPS